MLAKLLVDFFMLWSRRSAKDGASNLGSLLCGVGAVGAYLFAHETISIEVASWFALLAFAGGGLTGWTIGKPDNLGL